MPYIHPLAKFSLVFGFFIILLSLLPAVDALGKTDTITWGGSSDRTSYQSNHNMDPAIVGSPQFGLLFKTLLPGTYRLNGQDVPEQIFSLPLVYTSSDGLQYVYIATTQNNIYKVNAKTGGVVASRNLHRPFLVSDLDGCTDINPLIGVTATGVIDPATDTWYLTTKTYADQALTGGVGKPNGRYYVHAISTSDLSERPNYPVGIEGLVSRNNPLRSFGAGIHHQRPGLLQYGQYVYAGFASHCAQYNFSGWIIGWDKGSGKIVEHFTTQGAGVAASVPGAGVWMSGGGLSTDGKGSMFFATGNGYASQLNGVPVNGRSPPTALEEAAVHMAINDDGTLSIVDFFMPWEKTQLDGADKDLGTTPLELLPSQFQCGTITHMGVVTGKSGKTYFLNMDDLGGYSNGPDKQDKVIQVFQNENSVYAGAGVYPLEGGYIYISVIQYPTHVFKFSCNGGVASFDKVADSPEKNAYILGTGHGTTTSLNDQPGTGLLWVSDVEGSNLRIYNAVPNNGQLSLINSFVTPGVTKFTRPVFGDGVAYQVTTTGYIYAYGSPINLPLNCTTLQFGMININATSSAMTVQCQANVAVTVTAARLSGNPNFIVSISNFPYQVAQGQNFSFQAKFAPQAVGPLSSSLILNTTQQTQGFAINTPVLLKGIGQSQAPLLAVAPDTVSFNGVITGQNVRGVNQSITISNEGNTVLQIISIQYSTVGEKGPWASGNGTQSAKSVSAFTLYDLPSNIAANSGIKVLINFNPSASGDYAVFVQVNSNGGSKIFNVLGSGSDVPRALLEFESPNGGWVRYNNSTPFDFGNVTENTSRNLKLRLTNIGSTNAAPISLTVSKPPFGIPGSIIGASNQVDLGEGALVYANQSVTALMYCSVPKSQINVDPYVGAANWTINLNDLSFGKQQLHFVCNAVSEQIPPLDVISQQAMYRYAGCFKENNPGRQLQTQIYSSDDNTNGKCISQCAAAGYIFAGTQYNSQCWCGYNRPKSVTTESNCNFPCKGNVNEVCGGNGIDGSAAYISTFGDITRWNGNSTDAPGPYANPGAFGYRSLGCYTEGSGTRALSIGAKGNKTVASCLKACQGYTYAGIEYGGECYCDTKLGSGSVSALATDCSMACNNNQSEYCGGPSRLNMYIFGNGTVPPTSIGVSSSTTASVVSGVSSASAGPSIPPIIGKFSYLSCYTEGANGRALTDFTQADDTMTLIKCANVCSLYQYFGVEYGRECYCGSTLGAGSVAATDGRCNMQCAGDSNQICGGPNGLQMYMVSFNTTSTTSSVSSSSILTTSLRADVATNNASSSTLTTAMASSWSSIATTTTPVTRTSPITVPSVANFKYLNCYTEATNSRALTGKALASNDMTVGYCAGNCTGFAYMAIEYASECYCGNIVMAGSTVATDGRCSMTCSGNSGQICGGPSGLSIYQFSASDVTSSMTSDSSITSGTQTSLTSSSASNSPLAITLSSTRMSSVATSQSSTNSSGTPSSNLMSATTSSTSSLRSSATSSSVLNTNSTIALVFTTLATITSISRSSSPSSASTISSSLDSTSFTLSRASTVSSPTTTSASSPSLTNTITASSTARSTPFTSTSSSTNTIILSPSPWRYLSCYADTNPRLLSSASTSSNTITPSTCQSFCIARNLPIAGLEYSRECYCGSSLPSTAIPGQPGCSMACSGNSSEICGGRGSLSVYNYTLYSPPQHKQAISGYNFKGCYTDVGPRTLDKFSISSANMTQETCVDVCSTRGFKYAGAEYASQCFCGDGINVSGDAKGGLKVGDGDCNMLCPGDRGEWCGAGSRLSVWMRG